MTAFRGIEPDAAVIQLVGDMRPNIEQLICSLNCQCGAQTHIRAILTIYSDKITKLRMQRDHYKKLCKQLQTRQHEKHNSINNWQTSTQLSMIKHDDDNIFSLLHQQLSTPHPYNSIKSMRQSMSSSKNNNTKTNNENNNPEESLLLSEESEEQPNSTIFTPIKTRQKSNCLVKSFEEFLQEKIQQNHSKQKITQDLVTLADRRSRFRHGTRGPLVETSAFLLN